MPAPLAPVAIKLVQFGAVAAIGWYAARRRRPAGPREIWREKVMDDLDDGLETDWERREGEARAGAAGRWRRTFRVGSRGVEMDFAGLTRFRLRRADD